MKDIDDIFQVITNEKIILIETNLRYKYIEGIYISTPGIRPTICISKYIKNNKKKYISVLAEELGHHFTTTGDLLSNCVTYFDKAKRDSKELKAKLWAANYLIADEEFVQAIENNILSICDLVNHFNVTEEIIEIKIESIFHSKEKYNIISNTLKQQNLADNLCFI